MKKIICFILAACMMVSLAACGKKEDGNGSSASGDNNEKATMEATHYFEPEYIEGLPSEFNNSSNQIFTGNSIFFIGNNEDNTKNGIYEYSFDDKNLKTYVEIDRKEAIDPTDEVGEITYFSVSDNMLVYIYHTSQTDPSINDIDFSSTTEEDLYNFFINDWGYDTSNVDDELNSGFYDVYKKEDGSFDYGAIYKKLTSYNYGAINRYHLIGTDLNGNQIFDNQLDFLESEPDSTGNVYAYDLAIDANDNTYLVYNCYDDTKDEYCIKIFDKNGAEGNLYTQNEYIDTLFKLKNGSVAMTCSNDNGGSEYKVINPETATVNDQAVFSMNEVYYGNVQYDDNKMLTRDNIGLKLVSNGEKDSELYLKWLDSNILNSNIYSFGLLDDGRIALYLYHFKNNDYVSEIVLLKEADKEKLLSKTQIRVATLYMTSEFEDAVVEFNKKNNDYHIDVISFNFEGDDYDNYYTYLDNFMLNLATDNSIDVVALNDSSAYNNIINYAQKGYLIDLKPLIEADSKLNEEDFVENIIKPFYYDDKLIAIPSGFTITTLLGKKADVGEKMGWSPKKAQEVLESKGEGSQFMLYMSKEDVLEKTMNLAYNEFVNVEKGKCDFDNETFVSALEFSNLFPEQINYDDENYSENEPERVNKGKILVTSTLATDFETIQRYQTVWNDEATYIGYPSAGDNNGALISYDGIYGITKNCESPEVAWSLISSVLKNPKDTEEFEKIYGGYTLDMCPTKSGLEVFIDYMNQYYQEMDYTTSWDSFEINIQPLNDQMIQKFKDLVYSTTAVSGSVPLGVMNIIKEEASSYYSGQKTADEVAKIVQSRVKIYLSETR